MSEEPYTVTAGGETWTRNTLPGAKALADNLLRQRGVEAVVTLTATGWVEYRVTPREG